MAWAVTATSTETTAGVPVVTKELVGHLDNSSYPPVTVDIQLSLTTPARAVGPVPVMLHFGFRRPDGAGPGAGAGPEAGAGPRETSPTWQEQLIAAGWGHATLIATSVHADNEAGLT